MLCDNTNNKDRHGVSNRGKGNLTIFWDDLFDHSEYPFYHTYLLCGVLRYENVRSNFDSLYFLWVNLYLNNWHFWFVIYNILWVKRHLIYVFFNFRIVKRIGSGASNVWKSQKVQFVFFSRGNLKKNWKNSPQIIDDSLKLFFNFSTI
jgi:hypothetical protein